MKLPFGYTLSKEDPKSGKIESFTPKEDMDGATQIVENALGFMTFAADIDGTAITNETALITKYRNLSRQLEVERAIDDIVNEAIVYDDTSVPVSIDLSETELSDKTKESISEEFAKILKLMNFRKDSYEIFKRFYVDGRLYYHKIIDESNIKKGIVELRYIDPRKIKKIRQVKDNRKSKEAYRGFNINSDNLIKNSDYEEYYLYNPNGIGQKGNLDGFKIYTDTIAFTHSGIMDASNTHVLSYLHKSLRIFNMLRWTEDSLVIYRVSRAPERRVFNLEVGDMNKTMAESYGKKMMNQFRKRERFDSETGELVGDKKFSSIMEDYWFMKRDGKGTTVDVLQGGQNLGEIEDIQYFKAKLYESLNVPITRLESTTGFNMGRGNEITRDEVKFAKFINRLRKRFSSIFDDILGTQLILKGILKPKEWEEIKEDIFYDFNEDNVFSEMKEAELLTDRLQRVGMAEPYIGRLFDMDYVATHIMRYTEDEWKDMQERIEKYKAENPDETEDFNIDDAVANELGVVTKPKTPKKTEDEELEDKQSKKDSRSLKDIEDDELNIKEFIDSLDDVEILLS